MQGRLVDGCGLCVGLMGCVGGWVGLVGEYRHNSHDSIDATQLLEDLQATPHQESQHNWSRCQAPAPHASTACSHTVNKAVNTWCVVMSVYQSLQGRLENREMKASEVHMVFNCSVWFCNYMGRPENGTIYHS